jgi:hypothetical protein
MRSIYSRPDTSLFFCTMRGLRRCDGAVVSRDAVDTRRHLQAKRRMLRLCDMHRVALHVGVTSHNAYAPLLARECVSDVTVRVRDRSRDDDAISHTCTCTQPLEKLGVPLDRVVMLDTKYRVMHAMSRARVTIGVGR